MQCCAVAVAVVQFEPFPTPFQMKNAFGRKVPGPLPQYLEMLPQDIFFAARGKENARLTDKTKTLIYQTSDKMKTRIDTFPCNFNVGTHKKKVGNK